MADAAAEPVKVKARAKAWSCVVAVRTHTLAYREGRPRLFFGDAGRDAPTATTGLLSQLTNAVCGCNVDCDQHARHVLFEQSWPELLASRCLHSCEGERSTHSSRAIGHW